MTVDAEYARLSATAEKFLRAIWGGFSGDMPDALEALAHVVGKYDRDPVRMVEKMEETLIRLTT